MHESPNVPLGSPSVVESLGGGGDGAGVDGKGVEGVGVDDVAVDGIASGEPAALVGGGGSDCAYAIAKKRD